MTELKGTYQQAQELFIALQDDSFEHGGKDSREIAISSERVINLLVTLAENNPRFNLILSTAAILIGTAMNNGNTGYICVKGGGEAPIIMDLRGQTIIPAKVTYESIMDMDISSSTKIVLRIRPDDTIFPSLTFSRFLQKPFESTGFIHQLNQSIDEMNSLDAANQTVLGSLILQAFIDLAHETGDLRSL